MAVIEGDVDFLFDEQVLQDERIYSSEERHLTSEQRLLELEAEIDGLEDSVIGENVVFL